MKNIFVNGTPQDIMQFKLHTEGPKPAPEFEQRLGWASSFDRAEFLRLSAEWEQTRKTLALLVTVEIEMVTFRLHLAITSAPEACTAHTPEAWEGARIDYGAGVARPGVTLASGRFMACVPRQERLTAIECQENRAKLQDENPTQTNAATPNDTATLAATDVALVTIFNALSRHDAKAIARPTPSEYFRAIVLNGETNRQIIQKYKGCERTLRTRRALAEKVIKETCGGVVNLRKLRDLVNPAICNRANREIEAARKRGRRAFL